MSRILRVVLAFSKPKYRHFDWFLWLEFQEALEATKRCFLYHNHLSYLEVFLGCNCTEVKSGLTCPFYWWTYTGPCTEILPLMKILYKYLLWFSFRYLLVDTYHCNMYSHISSAWTKHKFSQFCKLAQIPDQGSPDHLGYCLQIYLLQMFVIQHFR